MRISKGANNIQEGPALREITLEGQEEAGREKKIKMETKLGVYMFFTPDVVNRSK